MARFVFNTSIIERIHGRHEDFVYYLRRGNWYSRRYVVPRNPDTAAQRANRTRFSDAVHAWQALSVSEREEWKKKAKVSDSKGYNLFLSAYMKTADGICESDSISKPVKSKVYHVVVGKSSCNRIHSVSGPVQLQCRSDDAPVSVKSPPGTLHRAIREVITPQPLTAGPGYRAA